MTYPPINRRRAMQMTGALLAMAQGLPELVPGARAQANTSWPARPVTLVAVYAAGGPVDIVSRIIAKGLSEQFGQQFLVENRVGAGGSIGAQAVARSAPDGYTLLHINAAHTVIETLCKNRGYELARDFAPVSTIGSSPNWLLVNPKVHPFRNVQELVAYAKANPGRLTYASGGSGGLTHLSTELMKVRGGLDIVHVPYKGNAPAFTDLIAGRVDMIFDQPISSEAFVKSGQLRPLAVTSRTRAAAYPEVPTMIESGFEDFEATAWYAVAVRAGTPPAIVNALNAGVIKVLASSEIRDRLLANGVTPAASSPETLARLIEKDTARWREVIQRAAITVQ